MNTDQNSSADDLPPKAKAAIRAVLVAQGLLIPETPEEVALFDAHLPADFHAVKVPPPPSIGSSPGWAMAARSGEKLSAESQAKLSRLLREMQDRPEEP